jgi:hypothetical protein
MLIPSLPVATFKVGVHHISNASNCSSLRFHSSFFFKKRNTKFYLHICTYLPDNYNLTRQLFLNSQVFFFFCFPFKILLVISGFLFVAVECDGRGWSGWSAVPSRRALDTRHHTHNPLTCSLSLFDS